MIPTVTRVVGNEEKGQGGEFLKELGTGEGGRWGLGLGRKVECFSRAREETKCPELALARKDSVLRLPAGNSWGSRGSSLKKIR